MSNNLMNLILMNLKRHHKNPELEKRNSELERLVTIEDDPESIKYHNM